MTSSVHQFTVNVVKAFPELFEPLFVIGMGKSPSVDYLLTTLRKTRGCCPKVFEWLQQYVRALDAKGNNKPRMNCIAYIVF